MLLKSKIEAEIFVTVTITTDGTPTDIKLYGCRLRRGSKKLNSKRGNHCSEFFAAAENAIGKWRWEPATKSDEKVPSYVGLKVDFQPDTKGEHK